jgi:hypothetical protein
MTTPLFRTVNLISGLTGAGKSSMARASGSFSIGLAGSDPSAVSAAINQTGTPSEVMLEIHPSAVPVDVAIR